MLDGHKTPDPVGSKYAGVVSRESVRIAFTYAALNDLDVCMADIRNAYLQSPTSQKHYIICGPEFGMENVGKVAIMHRAVYGGKTSGRDFRNHLRSCMEFINFTSCPADPDVQVKEYAANIIAENMLTQVDSDGMSTTLMEAIVDHLRDDEKALQHHDKYVQTKNGRRHLRKTTKGWELLIKWKDKSESWIKLADMKESQPVEVAEYARARGIDKEPAFEWWVPHTLKKRQVILSALKKRIRKTTHKYGIEIPTSVEHAFELDRKNGNNLWKDALEMEMYNIGVAFEILEDGKTAPAGYTKVSGHLIWSVKMDFTRKARWVAGWTQNT